MSAEIVNLRNARKQKVRAEKEAKAAQNRKVFGRSQAERRHTEAIHDLEKRSLSGKLRVPLPDDDDKTRRD